MKRGPTRKPAFLRYLAAVLTLGAIGAGILGAPAGRLDTWAAPAQAVPGEAEPAPLTLGDKLWQHLNPSLPDLSGQPRKLDEWKGKVLLINFWASWCVPCLHEIPQLRALQKRHGANGLQVIGIGLDQARPLANVARSLGVDYPVLVADDPGGRRLPRHLGDTSQIVPYSVVVDRDGDIAYMHLGEIDQAVFDEFIAPVLDR